jgi:hypothetical protein
MPTYAERRSFAKAKALRGMSLLPKGQVMIRKLTFIAMAAALAACNNDPIQDKGPPDPMAQDLANAAPVELPPAIASSKTYRCKDNSVVTIDWLAADKGAYVHGEGTAQTHVKAPEPVEGKPASSTMVAEGGYSLSGTATGSSITLAVPGKSGQSCKA